MNNTQTKHGKGLGRFPFFDPRNVDYLIADRARAGAATKPLAVLASRGRASARDVGGEARLARASQKYHWSHPWKPDQGAEGSCTGFAGMNLYVNGPVTHPRLGLTFSDAHARARALYFRAQSVDRREGRVYAEGATMLALGKAMVEERMATAYHWGYTLTDLVMGVQIAPVLLGVWWREGMSRADGTHVVARYLGDYEGGHAICATGIDLRAGFLRLENSWGPGFGVGGTCLMPLEDVERMLAEDGEVLLVDEPHDPETDV